MVNHKKNARAKQASATTQADGKLSEFDKFIVENGKKIYLDDDGRPVYPITKERLQELQKRGN